MFMNDFQKNKSETNLIQNGNDNIEKINDKPNNIQTKILSFIFLSIPINLYEIKYNII